MKNTIHSMVKTAAEVLLGKEEQITLALTCLFSKGHLLIEDTPGVGKTTLAKILAKILGLEISRIQFTNDLLPSDIIGVPIFNRQTNSFEFHKGPLFGQLILADELNRASPKTQSALLQAMEEMKITVEGITHSLPDPFFVIATQNPQGQLGTYPLPESQIDRFMMKLSIETPSAEIESAMLQNLQVKTGPDSLEQLIKPSQLKEIQDEITKVQIKKNVSDYIVELMNITRVSENYQSLSPRAGIDLVNSSKTWAFLQGRDFITTDDVQYLIPFVWGHRLLANEDPDAHIEKSIIKNLLKTTQAP